MATKLLTAEDELELKKLVDALNAKDEEAVDNIASGLLITNSGNCNWTNINALEKAISCKVVALEKDSFGWLVGGIKYNRRTYPYG